MASAFRRKDKQPRAAAIVLCAIVYCAILLALPLRAEIIDRVLASVDAAIITQSDVFGVIRLGLVKTEGTPDPIATALQRLIERRLTLSEVDRYGPAEPSDAEIQQRLDQIAAAFPPVRLDAILIESGLTRENLRRYVRDDLRIAAYIDQRFGAAIQPSEDEILQYYEQHRAAFTVAGVARPYDEARDAARQAVITERRDQLIADWLTALRKRANVRVLSRQLPVTSYQLPVTSYQLPVSSHGSRLRTTGNW